MAELSILFGRGRHASDAVAEDRFELEVLATEELGIESFAIPLDPVVAGEPERALRRLPRPRSRRWLYRGWMLNEQEYTALFDALADRDEQLVADPRSFPSSSIRASSIARS
jgi:hypothetical protein